MTAKGYADTSTVTYAYEPYSGRLSTMTDANGSTGTYTYNADDTLSIGSYTPGTNVAATPSTSFSYDSVSPTGHCWCCVISLIMSRTGDGQSEIPSNGDGEVIHMPCDKAAEYVEKRGNIVQPGDTVEYPAFKDW